LLALDVGERRIGVALASLVARLPRPLTTLQHTDAIFSDIQALISEHRAQALVLGLPRGLQGQHTAQTASTQAFGAALAKHITIPVYWQDEAVTSHQAEAELKGRGKPYRKEDIDALSATYILEDFLRDNPEKEL
jgi:putative Holliday junction resolvase